MDDEIDGGRPPDPVVDLARAASAKNRESLKARSVDRAMVREKVVTTVVDHLGKHLRDGSACLLPILGTAGAGKTVLAGQVHDELVEQLGATVLVLPCEMVLQPPEGTEDLDRAFGALLRSDAGLVPVVERCLAANPRVVVLFETLDYLLDQRSRAWFAEVFLRLLESGACIVFTCRAPDYEALLKPPGRRLGRAAPYTLAPVVVPSLADDEVVSITVAYLRFHAIRPPDGPEAFAVRIRDLAADRTPLREITSNPLLLIMLCDIFATTGRVPPDLTTSTLCATYCQERVSEVRNPAKADLLPAKQSLWRQLARDMWLGSGDYLVTSVPRSVLPDDTMSQRARDDLLSEGVLVERGPDRQRVGFIHQIVAEYSIAIYLRDHDESALNALLTTLRQDPQSRWYGWQIVRHLIALAADPAEADRLVSRLDLTQPPALRAAVLGAVARWQPGLLHRLVQREEFDEELLPGLLGVPTAAVPETLEAIAGLIRRAGGPVRGAATTAGELVARRPEAVRPELVLLLDAIGTVQDNGPTTVGAAEDLADHLLLRLLERPLASGADLGAEALAAVRRLASTGGTTMVQVAVRAHEQPWATPADRRELALALLDHRRADRVATDAVEFIARRRPWEQPDQGNAEGNTDDADATAALAFLSDGPSRSAKLRAAVVARVAHEQPPVREPLVATLFDPGTTNRQLVLICLQEAVKAGAAPWLTDELTRRPLPRDRATLGLVCGLLKSLTHAPRRARSALADWLQDALAEPDTGMVDAYLRLVYDDAARLRSALALLDRFSSRDQERVLANSLRTLPQEHVIAMQAALREAVDDDVTSRDAGSMTAPFKVRLAGRLAATQETARDDLLTALVSASDNAADQAGTFLLRAAESRTPWLTPRLLVPAARDARAARRRAALKVLLTVVREPVDGADEAVLRWLEIAEDRRGAGDPPNAAELALLLELAHTQARRYSHQNRVLEARISTLASDAGQQIPDDGAVRRSIFGLVRTMVGHPGDELRSTGLLLLTRLLADIDLATTEDGAAFAEDALRRALTAADLDLDTVLTHARTWPSVNQAVLARAVAELDPRPGRPDPLDEILAWQPADVVRRTVWAVRLPTTESRRGPTASHRTTTATQETVCMQEEDSPSMSDQASSAPEHGQRDPADTATGSVAVRFAPHLPVADREALLERLQNQSFDPSAGFPLDDRGPAERIVPVVLVSFLSGFAWRSGARTADAIARAARDWLASASSAPARPGEVLLEDRATRAAARLTTDVPDDALACLDDALAAETVRRGPLVWDGSQWSDTPAARTPLNAGPRTGDRPSHERPDSERPGSGHVVLAVATEWASGRGGLSSYNRRLCTALASGESTARVLCVVENAADPDRADAAAAKVDLVEWPRWNNGEMAPQPLPDGVTPTLLIGHSRITGDDARKLQNTRYPNARRAHLIHMSPDVIDWEKPDPDPDKIENRTETERDLGGTADVTAAVGHHSYQRFLRDLHKRSHVIQLDPGFRDLLKAPRTPPPGLLTVLLFGRMEDEHLKGVDLAARGLARALHRMRTEGRPAEVEFIVRGGNAQESLQLKDKVLAWAQDAVPGSAVPFSITPRTYTQRADRIEDDLQRASLVLMPSRAEAFGLVGVEAIEHGVPVLVSDTSGLGVRLCKPPARAEAGWFVAVTDPAAPVQPWAWQIRQLLLDREDAFARVERLRNLLVADRPWSTVAAELLAAVGPVSAAAAP